MPTVSPDVARSGMVRQCCTGCGAPRTMTRPMSTSRPASRKRQPDADCPEVTGAPSRWRQFRTSASSRFTASGAPPSGGHLRGERLGGRSECPGPAYGVAEVLRRELALGEECAGPAGLRSAADLDIHTFEGTETMQTLMVGRDITGVSAFT